MEFEITSKKPNHPHFNNTGNKHASFWHNSVKLVRKLTFHLIFSNNRFCLTLNYETDIKATIGSLFINWKPDTFKRVLNFFTQQGEGNKTKERKD